VVTIAGYPHGIGGMQRHTSDLCRGLVAAGHEVEVITKRHPDGLRREVCEGALWRFVDTDADQLHDDWFRASLKEFEAAHAERPFDVIHSESTCALGLVRAGVHRTVPLAVKYHGNFLGLAKANFRRALRSRTPIGVAREARSFIWLSGRHFPKGNWWRFRDCVSMVPSRQQLSDQSRSHLIPRSKLYVVPNGVDVDRFKPVDRDQARAALGLGSEPLAVGVGRLNREKGMHTAIRAIAALPPPARLALVGEGEDRARLEALVDSLGARDRVDFVGPQSPDGVASYLAAADVLVFPTERDEGAPMVLVEAMACGIPVVASAIEQIREVVNDAPQNGVLVAVADVDATTAAVGRLLSCRDEARRVGARGRERILAEYTLERMVERTVEVYEIAIRSLSPRPA
jgi:glycosyltransferase involved in cell wall biosynthesis